MWRLRKSGDDFGGSDDGDIETDGQESQKRNVVVDVIDGSKLGCRRRRGSSVVVGGYQRWNMDGALG